MRKIMLKKKTKEVDIAVDFNLDGKGKCSVNTGVPFLDHMLGLLAKHGVFDLKVKAKGDIQIDIHHTNEDVGIVLGDAFNRCLGDKKQLTRFGSSFVCMDDALVRCVLDISGRPYLKIKPAKIKVIEDKNYTYSHFKQFLKSFVDFAKITLHIEVIEGEDFHHILEAAFKAFTLSLKQAVTIDPRKKGIPSTKGKIR